jgi:hypothetical protein
MIVVACHACGRAHHFQDLVPFRAECEGCAADLHACTACRFHDRYVENECREDAADPVAVKDRRNLCEYFKPKTADGTDLDEAARAKAKLAALFGGGPAPPPAPRPASDSAADEAKRKLEALFKKS